MKKKPKAFPITVWKGIPIREVRPSYFMVDGYFEGKRERKCFKDLDSAKLHAQSLRSKYRNEGLKFFELTAARREDAVRSLALLDGRASLEDAAKAWLLLNPRRGEGESIQRTAIRYLHVMREDGCRDISIREKRFKYRRLCAALWGRPTQAIQRADLESFVDREGFQGVNRKNYLSAYLSLLNFYQGAKKRKVQRDVRRPEVLKPPVVRQIMSTCENEFPAMTAVMAILFYAGLRPWEVQRLDWSNIDLVNGDILVTAETSKVRDSRHVKISDNLNAWLLTCRKVAGPVSPTEAVSRRMREAIMKKVGLERWITDISRHTYASAHYVQWNDAGKTAVQLGHFGGLNTFRKHYKGLYSETEASEFWSITPGVELGKVIPLRKVV